MKLSLLDTDILSEFFKGNPIVIDNMSKYLMEYDFIHLSIITYYEILNGLRYKDAQKQLHRFEEFASLNRIIPLTVPIANTAASIFAELRKKGQPIGHTDTLIAGTAITNSFQLVTNNTKHFKNVNGLQLANWKRIKH